MRESPSSEAADDSPSSLESTDLTGHLQPPSASPTPPEQSANPSYGIREVFRRGNTLGMEDNTEQRDVEDGANNMSRSLPEDDGMQALRRKMQEIKNLAVSTEEKAKRMHMLMTQDYILRNPGKLPPVSLAGTTVADARLPTASSSLSGSTAQAYNVTPADLEPTYCPEPSLNGELDDLLDDEEEDASSPPLGCAHYKRNVKVQCYDCNLWFTCRHCHDASPNLPFPHALNRKMTKNMLCMLCQTPQPAAEACANCGETAAYYFCPKCVLWDNDATKKIYHCDDCGICRRGEGLGKDYVHCKRCNVCISISTSTSHPCIERATECDCPLCLEYLFSSSAPVVSLLCGHYMHAACYKDLMSVTYRCPVCSKSAVNMELQWRKLDDEIRMQPMPEEELVDNAELAQDPSLTRGPLTEGDHVTTTTTAAGDRSQEQEDVVRAVPRRMPKKVWVGCNDCGGRGWTPFHWLGLKCPVCDGYNTNQSTPVGGDTLTTRPLVGTSRQRQHDFTGMDVMRSVVESVDGPQGSDGLDGLERGGRGGSEGEAVKGVGTEGGGGEEDERTDSAYARSPPQPAAAPLNHSAAGPRSPRGGRGGGGGRYFLRAEAEGETLPTAGGSRLALPIPIPVIDTARFSPYDIIQSVSRSLSPMRGYAEGMRGYAEGMRDYAPDVRGYVPDVRGYAESMRGFWEGLDVGVPNASAGWVREQMQGAWGGSPRFGPVLGRAAAGDGGGGVGVAAAAAAEGLLGPRKRDEGGGEDVVEEEDDVVDFWGTDGHFLSAGEDDDEDDDDEDGGEDEDEWESEESDEDGDLADGDEDGNDEDGVGFLELLGHR